MVWCSSDLGVARSELDLLYSVIGLHLAHVPMSRLARTSVLGDWTVILVSFEMSNGYSGSYDSGCTFLT